MPSSLTIARRFRGPLTSANGGYTAGLFARALHASAVEVTLRLPPPLETPLTVVEDDGRALLLHGEALVAEAQPGDPAVIPPAPPSFEQAAASASCLGGLDSPLFAECFVCGTRTEGDGLEIHAGLVPGRDDGLVAAAWVASGVRPEIVWAAIDCPGAYSLLAGSRGEPVLARMTARVDRLPDEGERCVVAGWQLGAEGRKRHAATALYGEDGGVLAVSRQLWIEPRTP